MSKRYVPSSVRAFCTLELIWMLPAAHSVKRCSGGVVGAAAVGVAVARLDGGRTEDCGVGPTSDTPEAAICDRDWSMATASSAALVRTSVTPVSLGSNAQNPPSTTIVSRSITTVPSETPRLERLRRLMPRPPFRRFQSKNAGSQPAEGLTNG